MADDRPSMRQPAQLEAAANSPASGPSRTAEANDTGLPDELKSGVEALSGISMDDVKVHFNSPRPAQLKAHAFAQGRDIHLGPGQEKHLPHEAWHVVQQKQGRVGATVQMAGLPVNDDPALEDEADRMGHSAAAGPVAQAHAVRHVPIPGTPTLQGLFGMEKESRIAIKGAKSGVIAKGAGLTVEPDNGNGGKILEIITDPFDEHTTKESSAVDTFTNQLKAVWSLMDDVIALKDKVPLDEVFQNHGLAVKTSVDRRVHGNDSFKGPVHFTVGLKLQQMGSQLSGIKALSTKSKSKEQDARMAHVDGSVLFAQDIAKLATKTFDSVEIVDALAGYFQLAFLTIAGWQSTLQLGDDDYGLKKQIPLAFMKVYPSTALAGINEDAKKRNQPDVLNWVASNAKTIQGAAVARLPLKDAGKKSLAKWLNWLVGKDDSAIKIIDEQVTMIESKEALGTASAIPYGYAAELRNIAIGDQSSMTSVRAAGIEVIRMSRGGEKSGISEKDHSYSND